MSKYTTEVRYICEAYSGVTESKGYGGIAEIIAGAIPKIFDFDFPIYDESYRNVLCTKILKHYYRREIGAETVGLWKLWLDTRLNEIMPYYNQLYKSAMIEFDPMHDIDLTTQHTRDNDGTTDVTDNSDTTETRETTRERQDTGTGTNKNTFSGEDSSTTRDLYSDTPQGAIDNLENETYLTNARKVLNSGTQSSEANGEYHDSRTGSESAEDSFTKNAKTVGKTTATTTEEYVQTIKGKTGGASYSKRLNEFRSTFINIDTMIINELNDLFMNLW